MEEQNGKIREAESEEKVAVDGLAVIEGRGEGVIQVWGQICTSGWKSEHE